LSLELPYTCPIILWIKIKIIYQSQVQESLGLDVWLAAIAWPHKCLPDAHFLNIATETYYGVFVLHFPNALVVQLRK
jgi:hypothetical protein